MAALGCFGSDTRGCVMSSSDVYNSKVTRGLSSSKPLKSRAERTPGGVAVSPHTTGEPGNSTGLLTLSQGSVLLPDNPVGGGVGAYKELHAKPRNGSCKARFCLWAACQRDERLTCWRFSWATGEYQRLRDEGLVQPADPAHKKQGRASEKDEYREFLHDMRQSGGYLGFGQEADNCGRWGMLKRCANGHWMMKRLVCGREWCPVCGADDSEFHHRRMSRLAARVFSMESVGYFVFEVRLNQRQAFKSAEALREARKYLNRMLPRQGIRRGVTRWHFFGEARIDEFGGELDFTHYHPHLNILCDSAYIGKRKLKRIRRLWSRWLSVYCGTPAATAPVYYRFHRSPGKRWHLIRYITRPTFKRLNDSNRYIASDLFGFNNCSWFGRFTEADKALGHKRLEAWLSWLPEKVRHDVESVAAHEAFHTGLCPICGAPTQLVAGVEKFEEQAIVHDYGGGLYHVRSP